MIKCVNKYPDAKHEEKGRIDRREGFLLTLSDSVSLFDSV